MIRKCLRFLLILISSTLSIVQTMGQDVFQEKHLEVALRMVGHKVLLNANDSTSRVLPIKRDGNQYRIEFESNFGFIPEDLVSTIGEVMLQSNIDETYIVEVEDCYSKMTVYSFEKSKQAHNDLVACSVRNMEEGCFSLVFTFPEMTNTNELPADIETTNVGNNGLHVGIGVAVLIGIGFIAFIFRRKPSRSDHIIELGKYRFDSRNDVLILSEEKTELTGKEADLLQLLYASVNSPVKKEDILSQVWGDEGNYIGRTLDVYISKLRNKLQADPSIKIVNIRGVGYKLVIDD